MKIIVKHSGDLRFVSFLCNKCKHSDELSDTETSTLEETPADKIMLLWLFLSAVSYSTNTEESQSQHTDSLECSQLLIDWSVLSGVYRSVRCEQDFDRAVPSDLHIISTEECCVSLCSDSVRTDWWDRVFLSGQTADKHTGVFIWRTQRLIM